MTTRARWLLIALIAVAGWSGTALCQAPAPAVAPSQALVDSLREELHRAQLELVRQEADQGQSPGYETAERERNRRKSTSDITAGVVFLGFFAGLFVLLILRQHSRRKVLLAAIDHGVPVPLSSRSAGDARRPALVLMALGLAFFIAMSVTLSLVHGDSDQPPALAVSIWGVVPLLIGAALWHFHRVVMREQAQRKEPGSGAA